jgi:NAD(P)-dependent dehydrogenase (short-subunit alcohol dehydrogenase family)
MAREGADVAVSARTRAEIEAVAREIEALGRRSLAVPCDVMKREEIRSLVATVIGHFGRLDILVNNAGGLVGDLRRCQPLDHDDELFEANLFLNLTSAYYATRCALPQMMKQRYGRIINIGSGYAKRGGGPLAYSAAKHGLVGFTRALAYPAAEYGITVNCLCPGWTNTKLADFEVLGKAYGVEPAALRAMAESENIQKRILEPEELGPMAALLASPEGGGITGQVISVDGGYKV